MIRGFLAARYRSKSQRFCRQWDMKGKTNVVTGQIPKASFCELREGVSGIL